MVSFAAVCRLISIFAPPDVQTVTPKLAFFTEHKDEFDTLFIGSSRIYHGISPKLFDAALADHGYSSHSFNFGVDAMGPPESLVMVRRLIALHPRNLRRIFLEITNRLPLPAENFTVRNVYWQNGDALAAAVRQVNLATRLAEGNSLNRSNLPAVTWRQLAITEQIFMRFTAPNLKRNAQKALGPDGDGFLPIARTMSAKDLAFYHGALEKSQSDSLHRTPDLINRAEFQRLSRELATHDISVMLVAMPAATGGRNGAKMDAPPGATVFAFDDAVKYAPFYRDEARLDYEHLNARGAQEFTEAFAAEVASHLQLRRETW
jgi:hypothetical protein